MFQIGDRIVMNEIANDEYGCTKEGSTGVVLQVEGPDVQVAFDFLTGFPDPSPIFWVMATHCSPLTTYSQEERVLTKIRSIYARQYRKTGQCCFL